MAKEPIEILEYAISDVGNWRYWLSEEDLFQIEFGWVMLYVSPSSKDNPPSNVIALRFRDIKCVVTLEGDSAESHMPSDWFQKLGKDEIEPLQISYDKFTLSDINEVKKYLEESENNTFVVGNGFDFNDVKETDTILGFWSDNVGLVIVSKEFEIATINGIVGLGEIQNMHDQWWQYWRDYWNKKDSKESLPYDSLCEITIPAGSENNKKQWWQFWK
jgi:hypothetical protein